MNDTIKITPDLDIKFCDLMTCVDLDCEFTLRDVLKAIVSSTHIPIDVMMELLNCSHIEAYYKEAQSKPFEDIGDIEYLELYWIGDINGFDNKGRKSNILNYSSAWTFHGIGKLGVVPEDTFRKMTVEEKANFRECYAVELTPIYTLSDYKIKIKPEMVITNWEEKDPNKSFQKIPFQPSITLIEVLYWIIWELSFFGSPENRNGQNDELKRRVDEIDEAKKNGTLDEIMIPWEDVKANIEKKFGKNGTIEEI